MFNLKQQELRNRNSDNLLNKLKRVEEPTELELIQELHHHIIPYTSVRMNEMKNFRKLRELLIEKRNERVMLSHSLGNTINFDSPAFSNAANIEKNTSPIATLAPNLIATNTDLSSLPQLNTLASKPNAIDALCNLNELTKTFGIDEIMSKSHQNEIQEEEKKAGLKPYLQRTTVPHLKPINPYLYWGYREKEKWNSDKFRGSSWISANKLDLERDRLDKTEKYNKSLILYAKEYEDDAPGDYLRNQFFSYQRKGYNYRDDYHHNKEKIIVNDPNVKKKLKQKGYDHMIYGFKNEDERIESTISENGSRELLIDKYNEDRMYQKRYTKPDTSKWVGDHDFRKRVDSNSRRDYISRSNMFLNY